MSLPANTKLAPKFEHLIAIALPIPEKTPIISIFFGLIQVYPFAYYYISEIVPILQL